jgi:hypothetical protein
LVVHLRSSFRHWMFLPAAFLLLVALPIFVYIATALWTGDIGRLFLGLLVLAGYCLVAALVVKLCIAIDEQIIRHERLKPNSHGHYELPLEQQPAPGVQFEITVVGETDPTGYANASGIPCGDALSQERGYAARN